MTDPCTHEGIGLPGCETCDPSTDRNQDRRRRGKSPVCIDCGGRGELVGTTSVRWCEDCDVSFGWMVTPLSHEAAAARRPPPPGELVDALHEPVHESGRGRAARVVRGKETDNG